mmetsp:Transcript_17416/g.33025  ORF Transcript_17416/g.33025 Transcript_17416/m.33025 type:complete len:244 (-) Transcript_17416:930-1661(-)
MLLSPRTMMRTFPVNTLIGMPTKEIPLSLRQIRRQVFPPIRIKIIQTGTQGRTWHTTCNTKSHNSPPRHLSCIQFLCKARIHHEILQGRILCQGCLDFIQQLGANDTSSLPHFGTLAQIDIPAIGITCSLDDSQSLGIRTDFGTVQCCSQVINDLRFGNVGYFCGALKNFGCGDSLGFATGDITRIEGCSNGGCSDGLFGSFLYSPTTSSLHSSLVQNIIHDISFSSNIIFLTQNLGRNLNQV